MSSDLPVVVQHEPNAVSTSGLPGVSDGGAELRLKTNATTRPAIKGAHFHSFPSLRVSLSRLCSTLLIAVVFRGAASGAAWAQPLSDEYHVKAAFLYHFAQLVEWPANAFDGNGSPLLLCTVGDGAFYDELENTIQGKRIGSRPIRIRHIHLSQSTRGCNMLFVGKGEGGLPFATLRNLPVLTVGEADDFLSSGGMIRLHLAEDKIRFDINLVAADSSHLRISSRLMLLATSVNRAGGMDPGR
jgi:YfiR/HmsC-like